MGNSKAQGSRPQSSQADTTDDRQLGLREILEDLAPPQMQGIIGPNGIREDRDTAKSKRDRAKAAINRLIESEVRRARLEMQKEQVLFMTALLHEQGGKVEISRKSLMEADKNDSVIVHDDIAQNKVVYELEAGSGEAADA